MSRPCISSRFALTDFRVHERTECTFAPSVNLLYGPNGAGKTNVLDAIHYACLSKGFVTPGDRYIVRRGAKHTEVEGLFVSDGGRDRRVRMAYVPGEGKRMFVNGVPQERVSSMVGQLPVVACSPQDYALTSGGPDNRRRFLDNLLCQATPLYLDALLRFRRVLKQRNRYLAGMKGGGHIDTPAILASWDEQLVVFGSQIVQARQGFTDAFAEYLDHAYKAIESVAEKPTMEYHANLRLSAPAPLETIQVIYRDKLAAVFEDECRREPRSPGPHLDDLAFRLDDMLVRRYASQGQHRTFGMALKLAMYAFLQERTGSALSCFSTTCLNTWMLPGRKPFSICSNPTASGKRSFPPRIGDLSTGLFLSTRGNTGRFSSRMARCVLWRLPNQAHNRCGEAVGVYAL